MESIDGHFNPTMETQVKEQMEKNTKRESNGKCNGNPDCMGVCIGALVEYLPRE